MKIRIKATGEVVNTADYWRVTTDWVDGWGNPVEFKPDEVDFLTDETPKQDGIDWEQRRYEIAREVLSAFVSSYSSNFKSNPEEPVMCAITFADELIKQLKGE